MVYKVAELDFWENNLFNTGLLHSLAFAGLYLVYFSFEQNTNAVQEPMVIRADERIFLRASMHA